MPGTTGHESFKKVRKNILKTILSILVLALVAVCAQDMQAKKKTRKSTKARTTSVQRKKSKSRKGVKVRNRRRSSATTTRRVTPVKPLIIRGHDSIVAPGARFVTFERPSEITEGLDGRVRALWPSHGYCGPFLAHIRHGLPHTHARECRGLCDASARTRLLLL